MRRPRIFATRSVLASVVGLASLAGLATASDALAEPTKAQCIEADTAGQNERRAEQFHAAREHLQTCSSSACPSLVREDCVQRLGELESVIPTLVFAAKDASGDDVVGVRVTVDGAPAATELSGSPVAMDPGVHGFTFVVQGASPVVKTFVVREGERDRLEHITFADLNVPPPGTPPRPAATAAPRSTWNGQKTAAVVIAGAGVVGILVGAATGAMSFGAWSSAQTDCGPNSGVCIDRPLALADRSSAVTDATVSDVGFVLGGILVATGVVVYLTAPSRSSSSSGWLAVVPTVASGGGSMQFRGGF